MVIRSHRSNAPAIVVLAVLLCATAVGAVVFGAPEPVRDPDNTATVSVAAGAPLRVTFVGDSLDHGLYATAADRGFHPLMVESWRAAGPVSDTPLNSLGGTTSTALGNPDVPRNQDLVVVELGTNDVTRVNHQTFRQNYHELLERVRAASPDAVVLCVGPWRPADTGKRYEVIIKDLCEAQYGVFRSISDIAENPDMRGPADVVTPYGVSDDFHPNDRGHRAIADRLLGAVTVQRRSS